MVDVSANHILGGSVGGSFFPQTKNNFRVEISGLGENISLAVKSFPFPKFTVEKRTINYQNEQRHYAGAVTFENMELVCIDYIEQDIVGILYDWYKTVHDPETGAIFSPNEYKKDGTLIVHSQDGATERRYDMKGLFPVSLNSGDGDMDARGEPVNVTLTMSVDKVFYTG